MQLPEEIRTHKCGRTLEHLQAMLKNFKEIAGGNLKKAKEYFNVIHEPLLDIPIDQICIPGLHISLGLFLKYYEMLLDEWAELDMRIAAKKAEAEGTEQGGETDFEVYVTSLRQALRCERAAAELRGEASQVQEYVSYQITVCGVQFTVENANPQILQLLQHAQQLLRQAEIQETEAKKLRSTLKFSKEMGKTHAGMEAQLQELNVKRQAYHSASFVGNHIDICLKPPNIKKICQRIVNVLEAECPALVPEGKVIASKYEQLLSSFGVCHFMYNSSKPMTDTDIETLDQSIKTHIGYFRDTFPAATFPPKLHMLEEHTVPFIRKWKFPLGFFGEQGGESIHHEMKELERQYQAVKPETMCLKKCLEEHYLRVMPKTRNLVPQKKKRNLKRKLAYPSEDSS